MFSFGPYITPARIQPVLVTVLPLGLLLMMFLSEKPLLVSVLFGTLAVAGTAIGAQFGGELGRKREAGLWQSWGGPPTTRLLRHHRQPDDVSLAPGQRQSIEEWVGWTLPTEQQETDDPEWADARYREATKSLIDATRDSSKFPLVLAENINYGFRRNLWGMREIGRAISVGVAVSCWALVLLTVWGRPWPEPWWDIFIKPDFVVAIRIAILAANTVLAIFWVVWVRSLWVEASANVYAQRLMESIRVLGRGGVAP